VQTDGIAILKRVLFGAAVVFCAIVPTDAGAQSSSIAVSPNTNVLPGIDDPVRGDAYLQRQNEAVAAVSTRNPNASHAANDYRTVDPPTTSAWATRRVAKTSTRWTACGHAAWRKGENEADEAVEKVEAGTEAWIGMYFSNDAGKSYSSFFMPGHPVDGSVVGQATPAFGHQAASDPVLAAATAGRFYLGAMVFDRDPVTKKPAFSEIVVSTFTDRNNSETGLNFHFDRMTLVDSGIESGRKFLDKPAIVADLARKAPEADACGPVYIAYTVFDQKEANPLDRSKILLSVSNDCGARFTPGARISHRSVLNQGVNLAIRPSDGALFAAYRSFSENKIYVTYSLDGGGTFSQPQVASGTAPIVAFDQPTLGTPDGVYSFRTNGFPTIGIDAAGNVFVAWQERISADGNPRIFITSSTNGRTWSAKHPVETTRCVTTAGGPVCSPANIGPQVMPSLTFSRGRLMLAFYEARAVDDNVKFVPAAKASYITGLDVQLAARVAQLDANGVGSSVPLTHYSIGTDGKPPLISSYGGKEYRHVNRPNLPMYAGGTLPFIGDYLSIAPIAPFVPATPPASAAASVKPAAPKPKPGPFWRWATEPADAPAAAFVTAWGHNRDVVFPQDPATARSRSTDRGRPTAARRGTVHQSGIAERHRIHGARGAEAAGRNTDIVQRPGRDPAPSSSRAEPDDEPQVLSAGDRRCPADGRCVVQPVCPRSERGRCRSVRPVDGDEGRVRRGQRERVQLVVHRAGHGDHRAQRHTGSPRRFRDRRLQRRPEQPGAGLQSHERAPCAAHLPAGRSVENDAANR
jgi:hypothetical protein